MTKIGCGILLAAAVGCGSTSSEPGHPTGPCTAPSGAYLVHYSPRGGNCAAPPPDTVIVISSLTEMMVASSCTSDVVPSADNCSATIHQVCSTSDGGSYDSQGALHFEDNAGSKFDALLTIKIYDAGGNLTCAETFDLTYTRQ